ncbi:endophilin-B1-like isoform X1 [Petromyzon marinus]|uniref:endophilin-B1-like isoform X1 n=1 Tax=Petromyzon marinus TaxID=7757 RepID=UPI003F6F09AE
MDFNMKKLASDAGTFFTRAVQFTEEKLGGAERTELDAHFENLMTRADSTKNWTEKIMRQTEVVLQPNPTARVEEFVYEKLEKKGPARQRTVELLGQYMTDAGNDFGAGTPYGGALIKVGESQKLLGLAEKEFVQASTINFLTPLRNFLEGDYKAMAKERKLLQNKRLDLDASKTRLRKAKAAEARASDEPDIRETRPRNVVFWASMAGLATGTEEGDKALAMWTKEVSKGEQEVRVAQAEFDRQAEITRLLLEGISTTHANHLRCLNEFVEAQMTYYAQCYQYMVDLQKQMGSFPTTFLPSGSAPLPPVTVPIPAAPAGASSQLTAAEPQLASGTRRARVLYDYDAGDSSELSLLADEVITVYSVPGLCSDWLMSERGIQKGKVPVAYLELLK